MNQSHQNGEKRPASPKPFHSETHSKHRKRCKVDTSSVDASIRLQATDQSLLLSGAETTSPSFLEMLQSGSGSHSTVQQDLFSGISSGIQVSQVQNTLNHPDTLRGITHDLLTRLVTHQPQLELNASSNALPYRILSGYVSGTAEANMTGALTHPLGLLYHPELRLQQLQMQLGLSPPIALPICLHTSSALPSCLPVQSTLCASAVIPFSMKSNSDERHSASGEKLTSTFYTFSEKNALAPPSSFPNLSKPKFLPLGIEEDNNWLSRYHSFIRSELVEVFITTEEERISERNKSINQGQVGIRCVHCAHAHSNQRSRRSTAYPSRIAQIYQSFSAMLRDHFHHCRFIPNETLQTIVRLRDLPSHGVPAAKDYWIYAAKKQGLSDSDVFQGIMFSAELVAHGQKLPPFGSARTMIETDTSENDQEKSQNSVAIQILSQNSVAIQALAVEPTLVLPRPVLCLPSRQNSPATEYLATIVKQAEVVRMTAAESVGNRRYMSPGTHGLACRFCCQVGRRGSSRIFPGHKKNVLPRLQDLEDHLLRCSLCPSSIKHELVSIRKVVMETNLPNELNTSNTVKGIIESIWSILELNADAKEEINEVDC
jgi:hypothetical protein